MCRCNPWSKHREVHKSNINCRLYGLSVCTSVCSIRCLSAGFIVMTQVTAVSSHTVSSHTVSSLMISHPLVIAGFSKAALDFGLSAGLSVSGLRGPLKAWRERQLADIFASGQTLRLQFPKEDLGFVYSQGAAVCPDPPDYHDIPRGQTPQLDVSGTDGTAVNTEGRPHRPGSGSVGGSDRQYRPGCLPGGRMPHCMLQPIRPGQMR